MKTKQISTIFLLLFTTFHLLAQEDSSLRIENGWLENYMENMEAEESDLSDELPELIMEENLKFNINALPVDAAYNILKMSDYQYYQLLSYIERHGELVTLHELAAIDGFSETYIQEIKKYLYVESRKTKKGRLFSNLKYGKGEVLIRYGALLETPAGYDTTRSTHYLGSKSRICFKIKYSDNKHFAIGFAGEKDPGEAMFTKEYLQGFDHYSGYFKVKEIGILKCLIAGNFRINWGQGVILGSGLMSGSGNGVANLRRFPSEPQAVVSMNEGNYFTGGVVTLGNHRWQSTLFYGLQHFDASIQDDLSEDDILYDGTLAINGYHRTESELAKKRQIKNHNAGIEFTYRGRLFRVGMRTLAQFLSVELIPSNNLYRLFDLNGKKLFNSSADYQYILGKAILFGEIAVSDLSGFAITQGLIFSPDPRIKSGLLFRNYSKNFHSISGNAFGVNSKNQNETGIYFTNEIILGRKTELFASIDLYQIRWLRYRIDKPENGEHFIVRLNQRINRNSILVLSYLYRTTFRNHHEEVKYNEIKKYGKHQLKADLSYQATPNIRFKTHVETVINHDILSKGKQVGYLIYQDINYSVGKFPLEIRYRMAFFDTDSYEERIYAYEHDLNQVFNISGYYYRGWRCYLVLKYQYKFMKIQIKYSHTSYLNKKEIGSGLELIKGNHKNEIKAQMLFRI